LFAEHREFTGAGRIPGAGKESEQLPFRQWRAEVADRPAQVADAEIRRRIA